MTRNLWLVVTGGSIVIALAATQALAAQTCSTGAPAASPHPDFSAVEATIRALETQGVAAILAQDLTALERNWGEELMVNSPRNTIAPNRAAVLDIFRRGIAHYTSFERRIEEIRIDGDLAIVMGGETVRPIGNSPRAGETIERRFSHIWRRDGADWRLIARHANNVAAEGSIRARAGK